MNKKDRFKVSTTERNETVYGVKSLSSGVRDHGQNPSSLPHLLGTQKASYFSSLSLRTTGLMLIRASWNVGRIPWVNPFARCQAPGSAGYYYLPY